MKNPVFGFSIKRFAGFACDAHKKGVLLITAKEKIIQVVEKLSANATIENAMERLLFLAKVEKGLKQADEGETLSYMEVRERMSKWLKRTEGGFPNPPFNGGQECPPSFSQEEA